MKENSNIVLLITGKEFSNENIAELTQIGFVNKKNEEKEKWVLDSKYEVGTMGFNDHAKWIVKTLSNYPELINSMLDEGFSISLSFFSNHNKNWWADIIDSDLMKSISSYKIPLYFYTSQIKDSKLDKAKES